MSGISREIKKRWIVYFMLFLSAALLGGCSSAYGPKPWKQVGPEGSGTVPSTPPETLVPGKNRVTYESGGYELVGHLFLPPDYREGENRPAIIVTRPASGVKEQTAGLYAEKLSQKGFVTIAFDPKGFGESQGRPQDEYPESIIQDTRNTMSYVASLSQVDPDRIYNLGICMGAGYASYAAALDDRSKGAAAVSPYLTAHIDMPRSVGGRGMMKGMIWFFNSFRAPADEKGRDYFWPVAPESKFAAAMPGTTPISEEMSVYYLPGKPGGVPNWKNELNIYHFGEFIAYNPFEMLPALNQRGIPFFMAHAENGYSTDKLKEFYDSVETENKELHVVPDAGHFDIYWKPELVNPLVEQIARFFRENGA